MSLNRVNDAALVHAENLVNHIQDIHSEEQSLLSQCFQLPPNKLHNSKVAKLGGMLPEAVEIAEEGSLASVDADLTFAIADLDEHKLMNKLSYSSEWEEDSNEAGRQQISKQLVRSFVEKSDEIVVNKLKSELSNVSVTGLASLSVSDLHDAISGLRFPGNLPAIYCNQQVYAHIKGLEAAAGFMSDAGLLLGYVWMPSNLGPVDSSGDMLALVGSVDQELCVSDMGLSISVDSESSALNALNDSVTVYARQRFALGYHGDGNGFAGIEVA